MIRRLQARVTALKFVATLAFIHILLQTLGAERVLRLIPRSGSVPAPDYVTRRVTAGLKYASEKIPSATCLPQAFLARLVLGRRGYQAIVHIGVRTVDGELAAHAWTMSGETLVSGGPLEALAEFRPIKVME